MGAHVRLVHLALLGGPSRRVAAAAARRRRDRPPPRVARLTGGLRTGAPEDHRARVAGLASARPARDHQVEGYATTSSGAPGAPVALRVSTTARSFDVRAYRIGAYAGGEGRLVWGSSRLPGHVQARPTFADRERRTVVARWRTDRARPDDRVGAGPLRVQAARLVGLAGAGALRRDVTVGARPGGPRVPGDHLAGLQRLGRLLVVRRAAGDRRSWAVSFAVPIRPPARRRWGSGPCPSSSPPNAWGSRWPTSRTSTSPASGALGGARAYVSSGHDEYWSQEMRDQVERARATGTNLVFLGANTMYWRVRLERMADAVVVGYRSDAALDPAPPSTRTGLWREGVDADPRTGSPGWSTSASRGRAVPGGLARLVGLRGHGRPSRRGARPPRGCRGGPRLSRAGHASAVAGARARVVPVPRRAHVRAGGLLHDAVGSGRAQRGDAAVDVRARRPLPGPAGPPDGAVRQPGHGHGAARLRPRSGGAEASSARQTSGTSSCPTQNLVPRADRHPDAGPSVALVRKSTDLVG